MKMKSKTDFNKLCAEFLGWEFDNNGNCYFPNEDFPFLERLAYTLDSMRFDDNWNWIMFLKNKICNLTIVDEFNIQYDSVAKGHNGNILPAYTNTFKSIYSNVYKTELEVYYYLLEEFINQYNNLTK